jgi:hypothetical protein
MKAKAVQPKKDRKVTTQKSKGMVVIPYVKNTSEALARIFKQHGINTAMRPHTTLRNILVHPKDKPERDSIGNCVYKIPCQACEKVYIGETGRSFGTRMKEHKKEVDDIGDTAFTCAPQRRASKDYNKSAITDHASQNNHIINWDSAKIIDREQDRSARHITEAIHIRRHGTTTMNRDEGAYQLTHIYDQVIAGAPPSGARQ